MIQLSSEKPELFKGRHFNRILAAKVRDYSRDCAATFKLTNSAPIEPSDRYTY